MDSKLLEVHDLKKHYAFSKGLLLTRGSTKIKAVDGVSFEISLGETYGLVGESGCGKSTTGKLILRMEKPSSGSVLFDGKDVHAMSKEDLMKYRVAVQATVQDPYSSLDPRMRVGHIIAEPLEVNRHAFKGNARERVAEVLEQVGLDPSFASRFPHELSGGQRQRIAIARALALKPRLIVLDEPVSSLDVSIRAQILNLLRDLQKQFGLSYLLIAHDLGVVRNMSSRIGVMYLGKMVEEADANGFHLNLKHPYTQALVSSILPSRPGNIRRVPPLTGEIPSSVDPPSGCRFHPRCRHAIDICRKDEPAFEAVGPRHFAACHLVCSVT